LGNAHLNGIEGVVPADSIEFHHNGRRIECRVAKADSELRWFVTVDGEALGPALQWNPNQSEDDVRDEVVWWLMGRERWGR
jgi:hypothetical protein